MHNRIGRAYRRIQERIHRATCGYDLGFHPPLPIDPVPVSFPPPTTLSARIFSGVHCLRSLQLFLEALYNENPSLFVAAIPILERQFELNFAHPLRIKVLNDNLDWESLLEDVPSKPLVVTSFPNVELDGYPFGSQCGKCSFNSFFDDSDVTTRYWDCHSRVYRDTFEQASYPSFNSEAETMRILRLRTPPLRYGDVPRDTW
jgi:hypothetical protein